MSGSFDNGLESFTRAIEGMAVLKKLSIWTRLQASFRIRSRSLEEIDTSNGRHVVSNISTACKMKGEVE